MRSSLLAEAYLSFPIGEDVALRGMHWSHDCDAIEDANGRTVCLVEQLQEVLHGAFAGGTVPHFSHLMYLMWVTRFGGSTPAFERIKRVHGECATAAALSRNTGALIAHLCSGLSLELHPPTIGQVLETLVAWHRRGRYDRTDLKLYVAMPLAEAGPKFAAQIAALSDEQLRHWFRFGGSSLPSDDRVAEELESLPQRVLKLIAAARTSPRLVGAASLIPAFDAGLTIPPRKKSPDAVPQGGYADVTTRGDPDRLLPSQFALDPDEFVRRFAERELLYFQREEPHETQKPERVLVFDQGVRTWGRVRLALAGAVLSLLKYDARRIGDARLFVTSQSEVVALRLGKIEALQEVLEASDFTTDPCKAFRHAIEEAGEGEAPRDLIVLTHPRNTAALLDAAELRRPGDRIFTLAVDEEGIAKLAELRDEGFVALRSFRLDLQTAAEEQVLGDLPAKPKLYAAWQPWTGDVEPIGFPFRPGIVADVDVLGFTAEGDWLVTASYAGMLHAIACDGSSVEVLPRAMHNSAVVRPVQSLLPVQDGIIVVGKPFVSVASGATIENSSGMTLSMNIVHYDFRVRRVRVYHIPEVTYTTECLAEAEQHCLVLFQTQPNYVPRMVVELRKGTITAFDTKTSKQDHVAAVLRAKRQPAPPRNLPIIDVSETLTPTHGPFLVIDRHRVTVKGTEASWETFNPLTNGKPLLEGKQIGSSQLAGDTLALLLTMETANKIVLFQGPDGRILMELSCYPQAPFALSPDGKLIGHARGKRKIVVQSTAETKPALANTHSAKLHDQTNARITAKPFSLTVFIGKNAQHFSIQGGRLTHSFKPWKGSSGTQSYSTATLTAYDRQRFSSGHAPSYPPFHTVTDKFGLVHLIANGTELVASFCIRRELAAAWIPGGIFWGSAALIGGPPHPNGAELIGREILNAGGAE